MFISENRARYILYNLLKSNKNKGVWIIPANSCNVIPDTFLKSKTLFEIVDISDRNYCLDLGKVSLKILKEPNKYAGILFIYTYGFNKDLTSSINLFKKNHPQIIFIEDKCLCKPDIHENTKTLSDIILFSTGYAKYTDLGCGGFAFIKNNVPYKKYVVKSEVNQKMDEIEERDYLKKIELNTQISGKQKEEINKIYKSSFDKVYCLENEYNQWRFNIMVNKPDELIIKIFNAGLFASRHYCPILENDSLRTKIKLPVARKLYSYVVNLFNDKYFTVEKAELICSVVKKHIARYGYPSK